MERRTFLKSGAALPLAVIAVARGARADVGDGDAWRVFEVTTQVEVSEPAGVTRVWLPVPLTTDTDYLKNLGSTWGTNSGAVRYVVDEKYRAGIVSAAFQDDRTKPVLQLTSRVATRDRAVDLSKPGRAARASPDELKLALMPTDLLPTDGIVRDTARDIVKGKRQPLEQARAIYDWIVDHTFRDPDVEGCGWGDIRSMLESRNLGGKCADLNALFVGLARSIGIPARDVYGIRVAKSRKGYASLGVNSEDVSKAQHCRAEFYAEGYGWIPVDPADVRKVVLEEPPGHLSIDDAKVRAARERLFGAWEMNWVAYNYAHDLRLPGSSYPRVPYLMYPTGETAQGRLDSLAPDTFTYAITAREIHLA